MSIPPSERNAFLAELPAAEFQLLRPHLAPIELRAGDCLHCVGDRGTDVVFPHSGLVAMAVPLHDGSGAGVILVGRDGMVGGFAAIAAAPATCEARVHIGGRASRMSAAAFRYLLDQHLNIRRLAARFDMAMMAQVQQTALCSASHAVEARISRWLLEIADRSGSSRIPLTQNSLGQMLGVRRTTVTLVAGRLETAGALNCRRGYIEIVNREELEQRSCECYEHFRHYAATLFAEPSQASAMSPHHEHGANVGAG